MKHSTDRGCILVNTFLLRQLGSLLGDDEQEGRLMQIEMKVVIVIHH